LFIQESIAAATLEDLVIDAYLAGCESDCEYSLLAHHQAITIRYKELVVSPYETVERIYEALNLGKAELLKMRIDQLLQIESATARCSSTYTATDRRRAKTLRRDIYKVTIAS
jgi:hypothetical protein